MSEPSVHIRNFFFTQNVEFWSLVKVVKCDYYPLPVATVRGTWSTNIGWNILLNLSGWTRLSSRCSQSKMWNKGLLLNFDIRFCSTLSQSHVNAAKFTCTHPRVWQHFAKFSLLSSSFSLNTLWIFFYSGLSSQHWSWRKHLLKHFKVPLLCFIYPYN